MAAPAMKEHFFSAANLAWAAVGLAIGFYMEAWAITPGGIEFFANMAENFGMLDTAAASEGAGTVAVGAGVTKVIPDGGKVLAF